MVRDAAWFKGGFVCEEQPLAMQGQPHAEGLSWDWDILSLHRQF